MDVELKRSVTVAHESVQDALITRRSMVRALVIHAVALLCILAGSWWARRDRELPPPLELTVVPPWAVQTDDPNPDPLPPPDEVPQPKPKVRPPAPKTPPETPRDAVVKEKPKEKEKPKPKEPEDLRKKAKLVKTPVEQPKPLDLRDKAKFKDVPPEIPRTGKATASEKPVTEEEFRRLMAQGYAIGAKTQLATSEEQRCVSLIKRAIQLEWDKEDFNWFPGLSPLKVDLRLGPGGQVLGFRIQSGSGSPEVDRTARSALGRVRQIPGLSPTFLRQFPRILVEMTPIQG